MLFTILFSVQTSIKAFPFGYHFWSLFPYEGSHVKENSYQINVILILCQISSWVQLQTLKRVDVHFVSPSLLFPHVPESGPFVKYCNAFGFLCLSNQGLKLAELY